MAAQNVSFTIRRPTPVSREESATPNFRVPPVPSRLASQVTLDSPLSRSPSASPARPAPDPDSSDAESTEADELVTGFDKFGVQRPKGAKRPPSTAPLVIPALTNKDWRAIARKRRGQATYVPPSAAAVTGKDGSVGGMGTRDSINSGPVLSGLQLKPRRADSAPPSDRDSDGDAPMAAPAPTQEDDDAAALRAVLAEARGESAIPSGPALTIAPVSETDALRQDVEELPDAASLADYARVPVAQFGAALLRGMGWKEGTAATRKPGKGLVEPYLPAARPALLGIGAKEQEVYDDGSKKRGKGKGGARPERRYVPVIKQERPGSGAASPAGDTARRERSRSPRRSAAPSRRASPDRYRESHGGGAPRRVESDRDYDRRRAEDRDRRRDDDKRDRRQEGDRDRRRDGDRDRRPADDRRRDDDRDRSSRRESGYDRKRDR